MIFKQPFGIPAAILFIISIPLALGLISRNRLYGFRTQRTLSDDATWFRVNRFAGLAVMMATVMYVAITASKPYDGDFRIWLVHLAAFAAPLAAALMIAAAYAKRS